ncbi:acyltransferase domain-containing protein [Nocardia goodfellowii]
MKPSPDIRSGRAVWLVPGQGGDPRCSLHQLYGTAGAVRGDIDRVLNDIQQASGETGADLREVLLGDISTGELAPGVPQLAGYAVSIVLAKVLEAAGFRPRAVVGQSFGEIAALVCAGAFTVEEGTRAVCALNGAFRGFEGNGAMVLVHASEHRTRELLAQVGHPDLVLACINTPEQTVVSGPMDAITALLAYPDAGIRLVRLAVPYASHHPALGVVAERFRAGLRPLQQRPLTVPVYSPVGRRRYTDTEDLRDALVACVTEPVHLPETIERVAAQGHPQFIELGVGDGLCRCVQAISPESPTVAPLAGETSWLTRISRRDGATVPATPDTEPRK